MFHKKSILFDDLYRYTGQRSWLLFFRYFFFTPGFRYLVYFRNTSNSKFLITKIFWKFFLRQCMLRTGIQIPENKNIGPGFKIGHFGMMVMSPEVKAGKNFNICQGCSVGHAEGKRRGSPTIGDNVCIQANAVVVGDIKIGNNVLIGANTLVNKDIPDDCVVVGSPPKIIPRENASSLYIVYYV